MERRSLAVQGLGTEIVAKCGSRAGARNVCRSSASERRTGSRFVKKADTKPLTPQQILNSECSALNRLLGFQGFNVCWLVYGTVVASRDI